MKTRKVTITVTGNSIQEVLAQLAKARKYIKNGNLEAYDYTEAKNGKSYEIQTVITEGSQNGLKFFA
jgi:hypothetical protein